MITTSPWATATDTLHERLRHGVAAARALGRPIIVSVAERVAPVDPLSLFTVARRRGEDCIYWERPHRERALVGVGEAWALH